VILRASGTAEAERTVTAGRLAPLSAESSEELLRDEGLGESERQRRPIVLDPAEAMRRLPAAWSTEERPAPVTIAAIQGATPLGALVVVGESGDAPPSDEELQLLGAVAEETAVAIEKARLGSKLVEAQARSRELLRRIIDAEEAERRRIAGELHDRMGKRFFEFYYDVRLLQGMSLDRDSASSEILDRIIESARECAGEIRTLMNDLRPSVLDDFGFLEALKEFMTGVAARGELEVTLSIDEAAPSGGPEADLMLFRVLQEAVFNARKHSSAKRVDVEFGPTADRALRLVVRDDGRGFDLAAANPGHYGLLYMKERAEACGGEFAVRSHPRQGTEVEVKVPVSR
jgi:signal transduction histidine kinase